MNDTLITTNNLYVCEKNSQHKEKNFYFYFLKNIKFLKKTIVLNCNLKNVNYNSVSFNRNVLYYFDSVFLNFFFLSSNLYYNNIFSLFTNCSSKQKISLYLLLLNFFLDFRYAPFLNLFFKNFWKSNLNKFNLFFHSQFFLLYSFNVYFCITRFINLFFYNNEVDLYKSQLKLYSSVYEDFLDERCDELKSISNPVPSNENFIDYLLKNQFFWSFYKKNFSIQFFSSVYGLIFKDLDFVEELEKNKADSLDLYSNYISIFQQPLMKISFLDIFEPKKQKKITYINFFNFFFRLKKISKVEFKNNFNIYFNFKNDNCIIILNTHPRHYVFDLTPILFFFSLYYESNNELEVFNDDDFKGLKPHSSVFGEDLLNDLKNFRISSIYYFLTSLKQRFNLGNVFETNFLKVGSLFVLKENFFLKTFIFNNSLNFTLLVFLSSITYQNISLFNDIKNNLSLFSKNSYINNYLIKYQYWSNTIPPIMLSEKVSGVVFKKKKSLYNMSYLIYFRQYMANFLERLLDRKILVKLTPILKIPKSIQLVLFDLFLKNKFYQKLIGTGFFFLESLTIMWLAFFKKDLNLLLGWFTRTMSRIKFKKHKQFISFFKMFLIKNELFFLQQNKILGFKFDIRGKVGVTGNAKKRHVFFSVGSTSFSEKKHRLDYKQGLVYTDTGVLGLTFIIVF